MNRRPFILLLSLLLLPARGEGEEQAHVLVESQLQAAAAATLVLEGTKLPPAARAERLLPLAAELARLHAARSQVDAQRLEAIETRVAADVGVQQLALRLLRAMELCAASDYAGSPELKTAVHRLALAIEGETSSSEGSSSPAAAGAEGGLTEQSGAESAR